MVHPRLVLLFVWFITLHLALLLLVVMSHACLALLLLVVCFLHLVLLLFVVVRHCLPCVVTLSFHTFFKYSTHLLTSLSLVLLLLAVVCRSLPCATTLHLLRWCTFPLAMCKFWSLECELSFKKNKVFFFKNIFFIQSLCCCFFKTFFSLLMFLALFSFVFFVSTFD